MRFSTPSRKSRGSRRALISRGSRRGGLALWRAMGELWRLRDNPDWQEYKDVNDVLNRIYDEEATQARSEKGITQAEDDAEADRLFKQLEALEKRPAVQAVLAEEKRLMNIYGSSEFDGVVLEAIKKAQTIRCTRVSAVGILIFKRTLT